MNQGISTFHVNEPDVRDDNLLRNNTPEIVNKWPTWVRSNFKTISFKDVILKKNRITAYWKLGFPEEASAPIS